MSTAAPPPNTPLVESGEGIESRRGDYVDEPEGLWNPVKELKVE